MLVIKYHVVVREIKTSSSTVWQKFNVSCTHGYFKFVGSCIKKVQ